jgi:hypothetical protein
MWHVTGEVLINLAAVLIVFITRLLGFDILSRMIRFGRRIAALTRRVVGVRTVLLYTDCDDELHTSRTLARHIESATSDYGLRVRVKVALNGADLMRRPISGPGLHAVILLVTDVTQFTSKRRDNDRFQNGLARYAHGGGCLILGHDVVYRRSRNKRLQELAGCSLDRYARPNNRVVHYVRVDYGDRMSADKELLRALPQVMALGDNEVVIGSWKADVEYLYHWQDDETVPLVTRRTVGNGKVYWLNSGDSNASGPPRALAKPDEQFIELLGALIRGS